MYVHSESLSNLVCSKCKQYLSYFPIYSTDMGESFCGRCPVNPLDNVMRNEIFEALAEKQKFPCRYNRNGCIENLTPLEIPDHEGYCTFKQFNCPMLINPECKWTGYANNLLEHFEQIHPTFVLSNYDFEIDFVNSHHENYLLPHGEDLFILYRSTNSKSDTFICSLKNVCGNPSFTKYNFKIVFESNTKLKHEIVEKLNGRIEVEGKMLRDILKDPTSIVAKVDVIREQETKEEGEYIHAGINYELLQDLECMICMHYMVPPIYQCITGHSICSDCVSGLTECPTCKKEIKDTQNFVLASVIQHIEYPCRNSRCKFKAKPKDIRQHEASCIYGEFVCPLKEYDTCNAQMIYTDLYEHIRNNHYENLVETEVIKMPFDSDFSVADCYIFRYGTKLFKLHFGYESNHKEFRWSMELVGPVNESSKYMFEIDILDTSGGNSRFYFKMPCNPSSTTLLNGDDKGIAYAVEAYQIDQMLGGELCYRARILEQTNC